MKNHKLSAIIAVCTALFLSSCSVNSVVLKKGYDFSRIHRVAVLDFKETSYYNNAGSMVSELFVKHLLNTGYDIIERNELDALLKERNLSLSGLLDNTEQVKEFRKISGIDAIITGTIQTVVPERYLYENGNPRYIAAQVGITCRMISIETGEILWAGSDTYDSMNIQTAFEYLISSMVRQLMKDLEWTRGTAAANQK